MPLVRFIEFDGTEHPVDATVGEVLKQAALDNLVPGIIGDCGGFAECGTCHGYIDVPYAAKLDEPDEAEEMMLEGLLAPVAENSRLTCQVTMRADLEGIIVRLPEVQQ